MCDGVLLTQRAVQKERRSCDVCMAQRYLVQFLRQSKFTLFLHIFGFIVCDVLKNSTVASLTICLHIHAYHQMRLHICFYNQRKRLIKRTKLTVCIYILLTLGYGNAPEVVYLRFIGSVMLVAAVRLWFVLRSFISYVVFFAIYLQG